jgi:hypothetical protein
MKKFFKKIGKGFKELGKGLKKFFNSKIGRILGTIVLAIALPVMFNALFTGGVTAGVGTEMTVEGVIQSTAQAGVKETVRGVTAATAKEVGKQAAKTALVEGGKKVVVETAAQAITWGERLHAVALQTGELFRHPIQAVQRTFQNIMGTNPELLSSERATEYLEAINKGKGEMFLSTTEAGAITDSSTILDKINQGDSVTDVVDDFAKDYKALFPKQAEVSSIRLDASGLQDVPEQWSNIADKRMSYFDDYTPGTSFKTERNLNTLLTHSTPDVQADLLANAGFREEWINASIKTGRADLFPDPASFAGVRPYSSLKEAWTGGTGIKRVGRSVDQIASSRVKDVLPFEYEGFGAQANVVKASRGIAATSSLLMPQDIPEIEQPHYNPYAPQQATAALDRASQYGMTPTYTEPIDMFRVIPNIDSNQDAMSIYNGILQKNQMGMGYGPYSLYG